MTSILGHALSAEPDVDLRTARPILENPTTQRLSHAVAAVVMLCIIALALRAHTRRSALSFLGLSLGRGRQTIEWIAATLMIVLALLLPRFAGTYKLAVEAPWSLFMVTVVAPLEEELLYRGLVLKAWSRSPIRPLGAVVALSALWALSHTAYGIHDKLLIFAFGLLIGTARVHTDSLYPSVLIHALMNLKGVINRGIPHYY